MWCHCSPLTRLPTSRARSQWLDGGMTVHAKGAAPALIGEPAIEEAEVREALSGKLCGRTSYQHIVDGLPFVARQMAGMR